MKYSIILPASHLPSRYNKPCINKLLHTSTCSVRNVTYLPYSLRGGEPKLSFLLTYNSKEAVYEATIRMLTNLVQKHEPRRRRKSSETEHPVLTKNLIIRCLNTPVFHLIHVRSGSKSMKSKDAQI